MKAAFTDGNRRIEIRNVPDPVSVEGEVLLKIKASGMCGSDLHAYRTPAGSGPGMLIVHEPCGVVEELGPNVDTQKIPVGMRPIQQTTAGVEAAISVRGVEPSSAGMVTSAMVMIPPVPAPAA